MSDVTQNINTRSSSVPSKISDLDNPIYAREEAEPKNNSNYYEDKSATKSDTSFERNVDNTIYGNDQDSGVHSQPPQVKTRPSSEAIAAQSVQLGRQSSAHRKPVVYTKPNASSSDYNGPKPSNDYSGDRSSTVIVPPSKLAAQGSIGMSNKVVRLFNVCMSDSYSKHSPHSIGTI